jgi:ADP-ribosylglycohydrolase
LALLECGSTRSRAELTLPLTLCNSVRVPGVDDHELREEYAGDSLCGVRVGDALGETFFGEPDEVRVRIAHSQLPSVASWTDDTLMASSVAAEVVTRHGLIDPRMLLESFADHFDIYRGYGHLTTELLHEFRIGGQWEQLRAGAHGGLGSWGNGAAMRVAPLGAYWFDDFERAASLARVQAMVTHAHSEASEGAVAVAVAAALAASSRSVDAPSPGTLLRTAAEACRPGKVRDGLETALGLSDASPTEAAQLLGTGREVAAFDTVPFALWSAAHNLDDFVGGFWSTVAGLGDRDTTCAIAGGVIAARVGVKGIPMRMRSSVEPLPGFVPRTLQR